MDFLGNRFSTLPFQQEQGEIFLVLKLKHALAPVSPGLSIGTKLRLTPVHAGSPTLIVPVQWLGDGCPMPHAVGSPYHVPGQAA